MIQTHGKAMVRSATQQTLPCGRQLSLESPPGTLLGAKAALVSCWHALHFVMV
jgi:hypothetical protein